MAGDALSNEFEANSNDSWVKTVKTWFGRDPKKYISVFLIGIISFVYFVISWRILSGVYIVEGFEFLAIIFGLFLAFWNYDTLETQIDEMKKYETDSHIKIKFEEIKKSIKSGLNKLGFISLLLLATFFTVIIAKSRDEYGDLEYHFAFMSTNFNDLVVYLAVLLRVFLICILYFSYIKVNINTLNSMSKVEKCKSDKNYDSVVALSAFFLKEENLPAHFAYVVLTSIIGIALILNRYEIFLDKENLNILDFSGGAAAFHLFISAYKFSVSSRDNRDVIDRVLEVYYKNVAFDDENSKKIGKNWSELASNATNIKITRRKWMMGISFAFSFFVCCVFKWP